ncbi:MAG: ABC transporter ATP-binding protein [Hyphomicrobiales bacterium]|nr:ABC transporter ATP-binding protein [Hyphomicrobiales bacterium]
MTAELLRVRDLSVAFRQGDSETLAVDHVSFTVDRGETLAIVGESGSGKSVSALSIPRLLNYPAAHHPSGEIWFAGQDLLQASEAELRDVRGNDITMVFQEPMTSLNPLHTVERQIGEILAVHKGIEGRKARERTLALLEEVGIRNARNRLGAFPHQLSGGQRQRVMIAMALANEPKLLIADEPTTALDVTVQAQILALLKSLQNRNGMAMLFITHDLNIVRRIADRVCVMQRGKIVEAGDTTTIFASPQHPYTRMLIAAEPKGRASSVPKDAPVVMGAENVQVYFPIRKGLLRRTVDHVKAVDGISLKVRAGETVGVVGESGSGKTTLGLALLRLVSAKGRILFLGRNIERLRSKALRPMRKDMQVVFQDPYGSLSPRLSVFSIVEEGLTVQKPDMPRAERRAIVAGALSDVGIDPATMDRYPHEFSGGQRQRIAIARAMALDPNFVILDEPTSALDMSVQAQIVELLRTLQAKRHLAYIFISHDLRVVRALSNFVIVMRDGKVVEEGTAGDIFETPKTEYTKALIAAAFRAEAVSTDVVRQ